MKKKNNLDEAQELKMLQIEHTAYGIAFWGLLIALVIQRFTGDGSMKNVIGELVVFWTMCVYVIAACLKNGIWERKMKPTAKTNLAVSLIAGTVVGALQFVFSYTRYDDLVGSIMAGACIFLFTAGLSFVALAITAKLYKERIKELDEEIEE